MTIRARENVLGAWAFLIGVVLAIAVGLSTSLVSIPFLSKHSAGIYGFLVLLGLVVGFMNVNVSQAQTFMISGVVLVIVSKFGMESLSSSLIGVGVYDVMASVFGALLALFVPATIIVALKTVFSIANV